MIVFIDYKYLTVGGAPQLESNIVYGLNKRGLKAKVYCSKKSYLYERLISHKSDFVHIDSDEVPFRKIGSYIDKDDVICVTSLGSSLLLYSNRRKIKKMFFYSIHPDTFFSVDEWIKHIPFYKKRIFGLLDILFKKDAIFFMDGPNVKGLINRGYSVPQPSVRYIPVPDISESFLRRRDHVIDDCIQITYMGRGSEEWKIYPVIKILEDLNGLKNKFKLIIITDTNKLFQNMIAKYVPNNKVDVHFENGLSGKEMEDYLYKHSDLHFSMGIAALDGAKLGIPTILCDASHHKFPDTYRYKWLFESENYSLADFIINETTFTGHTIEEVIDSINNENLYNQLSDKCFDYVRHKHSLEKTVDEILNAASITKLSAIDYSNTGYIRRSLWVSVVSKIKCAFLKLF